jgi:hypothetical protein
MEWCQTIGVVAVFIFERAGEFVEQGEGGVVQ